MSHVRYSAMWIKGTKTLKKIFVAIAGFTVLLIGLALIVLPGPAFIVIPLGLVILATEFVWAKTLLKKAQSMIARREKKQTQRAESFDRS